MKRVRITKSVKNIKRFPLEHINTGEVVYLDNPAAEFLLKNGYAIQSKDMTANDYQKRNLSNGNTSR